MQETFVRCSDAVHFQNAENRQKGVGMPKKHGAELADMRARVATNLEEIMPEGKGLFLAYDQGFEHGPGDFDLAIGNQDPRYIIDLAKMLGVTAIAMQAMLAERYYTPGSIPLIAKLNGKTLLDPGKNPFSSQLYSVKRAHKLLEAAAVGFTIYPGSSHDAHMRELATHVIQEAHDIGIPAILWVYPRGSGIEELYKQGDDEEEQGIADDAPKLIQYAARIGMELGADVVKIKYCHDPQEFAKAVRYAGETKVVLSGGPRSEKPEDFLATVSAIMHTDVGAAGVAVGRNIWQRPFEEALAIGQELKKIIGLHGRGVISS